MSGTNGSNGKNGKGGQKNGKNTDAKPKRGPKRGTKRHELDERIDEVLECIADQFSVSKMLEKLGINRRAFYHRIATDETFRQRVDEARRIGAERLEDEAYRRAVEGVERAKYGAGGFQIGVEREYSDRLLHVLLKANKPEKYGENWAIKHQHSGSVETRVAGVDRDELRQTLIERLQAVRGIESDDN